MGLGCGGAVAPGSEYLDEMDGTGQAGGVMANGGSGGRGTPSGGSGGRGTPTGGGGEGGVSAGGSGAGAAGAGGAAGTGSGASGGVAAGAGGVSGGAGSAGDTGSAGSVGMAGSSSLPGESICVDLDSLLGGQLSAAFPVVGELTPSRFCGGDYDANLNYQIICLPPAPFGSCAGFYPENLISELYSCGLQQGADFSCGPGAPPAGSEGCAGNECCYVLAGGCPVGRPFLVHEQARSAPSEPRNDWLTRQQPDVRALDAATRRALADAYRKDGLSEHASVASFARFVLELLALGAPAELVAEAQAALADEIVHAQLSFGLASAYAGAAVGPGALDVSDALPSAPEVSDSLRRAIREGCIAETVSAALIRSASQAAEDPAVKAALARVASDERRHAVLAWRFVRWLIAREGQGLAVLAAEEFAQAPRHVGFGALTELPGDERVLRAHGYLSLAERRAIATQTLRQVVEPCAQALLRGQRASQAPDTAAPDAAAPDSAPASA